MLFQLTAMDVSAHDLFLWKRWKLVEDKTNKQTQRLTEIPVSELFKPLRRMHYNITGKRHYFHWF